MVVWDKLNKRDCYRNILPVKLPESKEQGPPTTTVGAEKRKPQVSRKKRGDLVVHCI